MQRASEVGLGRAPTSFQCAGFCATLGASSGRERSLRASIFSGLVECFGAQIGSVRTHNAEVVSSSLTLATNRKGYVFSHLIVRM
jgi:hypothetical protein